MVVCTRLLKSMGATTLKWGSFFAVSRTMLALDLYVIHTESLKVRHENMQRIVKCIQSMADKEGWRIAVQYILTPNPSDLSVKDLEARIKYELTNDVELDAHIHKLNIQEISNLEKHRRVWRSCEKREEGSLHMVIEDDVLFTSDTVLSTLIASWAKAPPTSDLIHLCCRTNKKLWDSKEAYVVSPVGARSLLAATEQIRFNARGHLSHWAFLNPKRVQYVKECISVDGSKVGAFPSSIHTHNSLVFNKEYMDLLKLINAKIIPAEDVLQRYFSMYTNGSCTSPDFGHLLGVMFHRAGQNEKARQLFMASLQDLSGCGGLLTNNSDIMVNSINIHKFLQADLQDVSGALKYSDKTALL